MSGRSPRPRGPGALDLAIAALMIAAGNAPVGEPRSPGELASAAGAAAAVTALLAWARALYLYAASVGPPPYRGAAARVFRRLLAALAAYTGLWALSWLLGVARVEWGCGPCLSLSYYAGLAAVLLYGVAARLAPAYALAGLAGWRGHSLPVAAMIAATAASSLAGLAVDYGIEEACGAHCKYTRLYYPDPALAEAIDAGLERPWWPSWGGLVQTLLYPRLLAPALRVLGRARGRPRL